MPNTNNNAQTPSRRSRFTDQIRNWFSEMPFVTRFVISLCIILYIVGALFGQNDGALCMFPAAIANRPIELYRIITSAFLHLGILHLGFNMMAFAPMGSSLERLVGSLAFLHLLFVFVLLSGIVDMFLSVMGLIVGYYDWFGACGIGFSGVLFGLIVLESRLSPNSHQSIFGLFRVPKAVYPWAMLIAIQLLMPGVSFIGHLSGMLVGYMHTFGLLKWLGLGNNCISRVETSHFFNFLTQRHGYFTNPNYGSTGGAYPSSQSRDGGGGGVVSRIKGWFNNLRSSETSGWQEPNSNVNMNDMEEGRSKSQSKQSNSNSQTQAAQAQAPAFTGTGYRLGTVQHSVVVPGTGNDDPGNSNSMSIMNNATNAEIVCHDRLVEMGIDDAKAWSASKASLGDVTTAFEWLEENGVDVDY